MAKPDYPITPAIRFLREHNIAFEPKLYPYVEHGGTATPAQHFGVDEHAVVKTIVLENDKKQGLICIMHGDKHISTRNLARELGMAYAHLCGVLAPERDGSHPALDAVRQLIDRL